MNDFVAELEAELLAAAWRRRRAAQLLRRLPRLSAIVPAVTVAGSLAVAVLALVSMGTRGDVRGGGPYGTAARPPSVPVAARPYLAAFAALRRPQTVSERAFAVRELSDHRGAPFRVIPGLTRLLGRLPDGDPVYLSVEAPAPSVLLGVGETGDVAALWVAGPSRLQSTVAYTEGATGTLRRAQLPLPHWDDRLVGLVPDAVTHIVWHLAGGLRVIPRIAGNLATAPLPVVPVEPGRSLALVARAVVLQPSLAGSVTLSVRSPRRANRKRWPSQPAQKRQPTQSSHPTQPRQNAQPAQATDRTVTAHPAIAADAAVPALPATATLPSVAADPAVAALHSVPTLPAVARLWRVSTEAAVTRLVSVATDTVVIRLVRVSRLS